MSDAKKALDRYKKIFPEYIIEVISKDTAEHIYWRFPNNWGAWLYCATKTQTRYEINSADAPGYSFENWLPESELFPIMEIVPVRYSNKDDNKENIDRAKTTSQEASYIQATPDYDSQDVISFPFFDPQPISVINLLTKIKSLKNES